MRNDPTTILAIKNKYGVEIKTFHNSFIQSCIQFFVLTGNLSDKQIVAIMRIENSEIKQRKSNYIHYKNGTDLKLDNKRFAACNGFK